jgi:hypothetical protein
MAAIWRESRSTPGVVAFRHAFAIGGDTRLLPAGRYEIETHEEVHQGAFEPIVIATGVDLIVRDAGGATTRIVTPADLHAALTRDRAASEMAEPSENPDRLAPRC